MAVNTKAVQGRRAVRYESYDDLISDIRQLAANGHYTPGNWSLVEIVEHLAKAVAVAFDSPPFRASWFMRSLAKLLMKKRFLTKTLPAGFKIPSSQESHLLSSTDSELEPARAHLEDSIHRLQGATEVKLHPVFDKLSQEEWNQSNPRHDKLRMRVVVSGQPV